MENQFFADRDYNLWWLLRQTRHVLTRARDKELSRYGITSPQEAVLFVVKVVMDRDGEVTLGKISKWLPQEPHTISRICTRMAKDGLMTKTRGLGKKNGVKITLTEKGEQAYRQSLARKSIKEVMSCLSEEERQQLHSCLKKLRDKGLDKLNEPITMPFP